MESKHMPSPEQVQKVIDTFEKALPLANKTDNHLNMGCTGADVNSAHSCGTSCCHGGWYAIITGKNSLFELIPRTLSFYDGALNMAQDLGFNINTSIYHNSDHITANELLTWAASNPDIWGNENGLHMFSSNNGNPIARRGKMAFFHPVKRPCGAENLQDIVDHWKEVKERIVEFNKPKVPQYKNIVKELAVLPVEETADQPVKELV